MNPGLNLIAATCEGMGIGINGNLPWRLKSEMAFFTKMTSKTVDPNKKNVVLMGRRTWECIPNKFRPLKDRINMVLTSQQLNLSDEAIVCHSLQNAIEKITSTPLKDKVEKIWVIGGGVVYKESMNSPYFHRLYLTRVKKQFECDTFFPPLPKNFDLVCDPDVPKGIQEENDIQFEYEVYEKV
ncbi:dihydrofolate reductase [Leptopilina boulardi]|uniref:dihydrofolate reductase n=1 Tax=Leptopilina boulardi TaxID=63433 RepID=UPI0021F50936|nr:dihydrofolate reductase [Leptopilina boulardi]